MHPHVPGGDPSSAPTHDGRVSSSAPFSGVSAAGCENWVFSRWGEFFRRARSRSRADADRAHPNPTPRRCTRAPGSRWRRSSPDAACSTTACRLSRDHPPDRVWPCWQRCSPVFRGAAARRRRSRFYRGHRPSRRVRRAAELEGSWRELEQDSRRVQAEAGAPVVSRARGPPWCSSRRPSRCSRATATACPSYATWSASSSGWDTDGRTGPCPRRLAFRRQTQCSSGPSTETRGRAAHRERADRAFDAPGPDQAQAFVFNRQTDGRVRVFSDFVEGFNPKGASCVSCPGGLTALEVHDAERLQGLPRLDPTSRPPAIGTPVDNPRGGTRSRRRWMRSATRIGARLANPASSGPRRLGRSLRVPDHGPVAAAPITSSGSMRGGRVPSEGARGARRPPSARCLAAHRRRRSSAEVVTKETALDCVKARAAGWQPPPQLIAVEVAAELPSRRRRRRRRRRAGCRAKPGEKRAVPPALQDPVAAQAAALAALAPMMAAVRAADAGAGMAGWVTAAALAAAAETAPSPKVENPAHGTRPRKNPRRRRTSPRRTTPTMTRTRSRTSRFGVGRSRRLCGEAPRTVLWPGLKVDLKKDKVPPETMNMRKENEALVIFGENSFGWVREDQVLDFKEARRRRGTHPQQGSVPPRPAGGSERHREARRRFVPPAIQQRGKSGGHHGHANGHAHKKDVKKDGDGGARSGEKSRFTCQPARRRRERVPVASAAGGVASGGSPRRDARAASAPAPPPRRTRPPERRRAPVRPSASASRRRRRRRAPRGRHAHPAGRASVGTSSRSSGPSTTSTTAPRSRPTIRWRCSTWSCTTRTACASTSACGTRT